MGDVYHLILLLQQKQKMLMNSADPHTHIHIRIHPQPVLQFSGDAAHVQYRSCNGETSRHVSGEFSSGTTEDI